MSYFVNGSLLSEYFITSGTGINDVTPPQPGAKVIASIEVTEHNSLVANLTIVIYDPVNAITYYKRNAKAMTAGETIRYDEPFWLPNGWLLRVTMSASVATVIVNYFDPEAAAGK